MDLEIMERVVITEKVKRYNKGMLSYRTLYNEWKGKMLQDTINNWSPLGRVISSILLNLLVDEFIRELDKEGFNLVGYAENFGSFIRASTKWDYQKPYKEISGGQSSQGRDSCFYKEIGIRHETIRASQKGATYRTSG